MKYQKKAQAAMEFLMTYGWAILVVIIAIGMLMYFIQPTGMLPEKCNVPTWSGLFCEKHNAITGMVSLKMRNSLAETIQIVRGNLTDGTDYCSFDVTNPLTLNPGDSGSVNFSVGGITCDTLTAANSKVQASMLITYSDTDGFQKTVGGDIIVKVP